MEPVLKALGPVLGLGVWGQGWRGCAPWGWSSTTETNTGCVLRELSLSSCKWLTLLFYRPSTCVNIYLLEMYPTQCTITL